MLRELPAASEIFVSVVAVCDKNCRLGRQSNGTKPSGDLLAQCDEDPETQVGLTASRGCDLTRPDCQTKATS